MHPMNRTGLLLVLAWAVASVQAQAQGPAAIAISEAFTPGYQYHVACRVNIKGELILPAEKGQPAPAPIEVKGKSIIKYDERILEMKGAEVDRTVRFYEQMYFE